MAIKQTTFLTSYICTMQPFYCKLHSHKSQIVITVGPMKSSVTRLLIIGCKLVRNSTFYSRIFRKNQLSVTHKTI